MLTHIAAKKWRRPPLEAESKTRPLRAAEELEQKHLQARLAAYSRTPELTDCARINLLKALRADLLTLEEKEELKRLEARYPKVPLDLTRIEGHVPSLEKPSDNLCSIGPAKLKR